MIPEFQMYNVRVSHLALSGTHENSDLDNITQSQIVQIFLLNKISKIKMKSVTSNSLISYAFLMVFELIVFAYVIRFISFLRTMQHSHSQDLARIVIP